LAVDAFRIGSRLSSRNPTCPYLRIQAAHIRCGAATVPAVCAGSMRPTAPPYGGSEPSARPLGPLGRAGGGAFRSLPAGRLDAAPYGRFTVAARPRGRLLKGLKPLFPPPAGWTPAYGWNSPARRLRGRSTTPFRAAPIPALRQVSSWSRCRST